MKEGVRLLEGGGGKFNLISSDGVESSLKVLHRFQQAAASRGASLRAVATSAVREARNGELCFLWMILWNSSRCPYPSLNTIKSGILVF